MSRIQPHDHSPEAINERLSQSQKNNYLRDFIYGGIDGAVTTFAVVSGVQGANLSLNTILILGFANLVADGFSMAASNYLGTRAESEEWSQLEDFEKRQIRREPQGETEEVRQILARKGFEGDVLDKAVAIFTRDHNKWVDFMLTEEYGLPKSVRSPYRAAGSTFLAFVICGLVPLLPFVLKLAQPYLWAWSLTGLTFFAIGSVKSRWSLKSWYRSGLNTFVLGMIAALLAYIVGSWLGALAEPV